MWGVWSVSEFMSVADAASVLGVSLTDAARLIVSGELLVDVVRGAPVLDTQTVRVSAGSVRRILADRAVVWGGTVDRSEADRILGRKYSRRNWPPSEWVPSVRVSEPVVAVDELVGVSSRLRGDGTALVLSWINDMGVWQPRVSEMVRFLCVSTKQMSRADVDAALVELESLNVVQVVKARSGSRGPRPKVAQLMMWYFDLLRSGKPLGIDEIRRSAGVS